MIKFKTTIMRKYITLFLWFTLLIAGHGGAQSITDVTVFDIDCTPAITTNNFKCIGIEKGDNIWDGTQYGGLYKYNPITKVWQKSTELSNVFINDI